MASCYPIQVSGTGLCPFNLQILRRLVLVPLYNESGELNKFDSPEDVTKAAIQAKFDDAESLNRFYSLPLMENVEQPRAETTFFEYNSGNKARVKQGTRTFTGWLPDSDPQFLGRMQSWYNQDFGFYAVDKWGNFVYAKNLQDTSDNAAYPIPIDGASWDVNMVTTTDAEPFYNMLQFDYKQDFNDAAIRYVDIQALDLDGRTADFYGLLPLVPTVPTPATGVTTVAYVKTDYDTPVTGLITANFEMYDVTNEGDLNVSNVVEDAITSGKYTITSDAVLTTTTVKVTVTETKYQTGSVDFVAP